jgi:hypothetical protein
LKAQVLRDRLFGSPLADVPGIIADLKPYRTWVDPLLRVAYAEAKEVGNSQKELHAALALLPVDEIQLNYLKDRLLRADAQEIAVLRQSLAGHADSLVADYWKVLEKPTREDQGKGLQAASALALYDPHNPSWGQVCTDVANRLVSENAYGVAYWIDALHPVSEQLRQPLLTIFGDEKREESERTLAASALAEYLTAQPDQLAELIIDATERQFKALYASVERHSARTAPLLEAELAKKSPSKDGVEPSDVNNQVWGNFYKRQTNAAVALIRMGRVKRSWPLLKHSPDPTLRSYLIHRLGPLGYETGPWFAQLTQEDDVSTRRALILVHPEVACAN